MKRIRTRQILFLVTLAGCITLAGEDDTATETDLIEQLVMQDGVTFSEIEDSGRKRWEVRGSNAEAVDFEHIRIHNVNATFLTDNDRKVIMLTEYADINRETMEIKTDQYVTIISDEHIMTGTGLRITTNDKKKLKKFSILKDVQIITVHEKEEMNIGTLKRTL